MEHVEGYLRTSRRWVEEKVVCFAIDEQHTQIYLERERERERERKRNHTSMSKLCNFKLRFVSSHT